MVVLLSEQEANGVPSSEPKFSRGYVGFAGVAGCQAQGFAQQRAPALPSDTGTGRNLPSEGNSPRKEELMMMYQREIAVAPARAKCTVAVYEAAG